MDTSDPSLVPFDHRSCFSFWDLIHYFREAVPAPVVEPDEPETPERVLRREAAALGVRILDLRGLKRNKDYPFRNHCVVRDGKVLSLREVDIQEGDEDFGIWGWYRDKEKKVNKPTRGRAHGKLTWEKCSTTILHTMDVSAGPARCLGMPVQNAIANDGTIVLMHSIIARCYASHAGNSFSDSVEISGKDGAITEVQIGPAKALFRYIIASKRRHTERQLYLAPHAFTHWSRKMDCDAAIWEQVGLPVMEELGLKLGPVVGSGTHPDWLGGVPSNR